MFGGKFQVQQWGVQIFTELWHITLYLHLMSLCRMSFTKISTLQEVFLLKSAISSFPRDPEN